MRTVAAVIGCLGALARVAFADVAAPGEILFNDAVVDVAGARVARTVTGKQKCDFSDTEWERNRRARSEDHKWPFYYVAGTKHWTLSADQPGPRNARRYHLTDAAGNTHIVGDGDLAAIVEDGAGKLLGFVGVDEEKHQLRFVSPEGAERWRLSAPRLWGDSASVALDGEQLVIATFSRYSTGSQLLAVNLASGKVNWEADVEQLNVAHSEYYNDVTVEKRGQSIVMHGTEAAGCYLQIFDRATGKRRLALKNKLW